MSGVVSNFSGLYESLTTGVVGNAQVLVLGVPIERTGQADTSLGDNLVLNPHSGLFEHVTQDLQGATQAGQVSLDFQAGVVDVLARVPATTVKRYRLWPAAALLAIVLVSVTAYLVFKGTEKGDESAPGDLASVATELIPTVPAAELAADPMPQVDVYELAAEDEPAGEDVVQVVAAADLELASSPEQDAEVADASVVPVPPTVLKSGQGAAATKPGPSPTTVAKAVPTPAVSKAKTEPAKPVPVAAKSVQAKTEPPKDAKPAQALPAAVAESKPEASKKPLDTDKAEPKFEVLNVADKPERQPVLLVPAEVKEVKVEPVKASIRVVAVAPDGKSAAMRTGDKTVQVRVGEQMPNGETVMGIDQTKVVTNRGVYGVESK